MRPSKDVYLMRMALTASERATCDRKHVGCVIASPEGHIRSTGYNGSAPDAPHCDDVGHYMVDGHCVRTIHAERNAINQAAQAGTSTKGCYAYVTAYPCTKCLMDLMVAGIVRVYVGHEYWNAGAELNEVLGISMDIVMMPDGWETANTVIVTP